MTPEQEKEILKFWQDKNIFEKSLKQTSKGKPFVFYEGPPTANGRPGLHHVLARSFKDIICRFKTMQGHFVRRQAGWDTHGLPVEVQVEKELGLKSKRDIENLVPGNKRQSIIAFNKKCRESVWRYQELWEDLTQRMGYWLDLKNPYITYESGYIESLWWIFAEINKRGLLYQGHKILPWCPRCGTGLSSHEVAQGYKTVTDNSIYVKFKLLPGQKIGKNFTTSKNTYILSWTTTPWTLPGNVALAVGKNIKYSIVKNNEADFIVASELKFSVFNQNTQDNSVISGTDLIGLKYEPLFHIPELIQDKSYQIYPANFVTTEDGTGVVHTAVMYGEDDYALGQSIGLPAIHTVGADGRFLESVPELANLPAKNIETEKKIFAYLERKNLIFKIAPHEHEYPFCWRCDTPVIYYARSSWFIKTTAIKNQLIKNNQSVNWLPTHLKNGRFGEWLKNVKDWAISRERYWATPLPIWQCADCGLEKVISSLKELGSLAVSSHNNYLIMRHGQAVSNVKKRLSSYPEKFSNPLTKTGRAEVLASAAKLKKSKIDLIIASDLTRTKATARLLADVLGVKVVFDKRLREKDFYKQNGGNAKAEDPEINEPRANIQKRVFSLLLALDRKYQNRRLLIVSHGEPLAILAATAAAKKSSPMLKTGAFQKLDFKRYPRDEAGNIDLHRPYVDDLKLVCSCGGELTRIPELADVWFDAGAMPFAAPHFPFQTKKLTAAEFPANYISEAVDQTRGWFYTLLAISTILDKGPAYKNVISLGHINDKHGKKMSKSKGNIIDPWEMMDKYGADVVRWHLYTINNPGEAKNFDEADLKRVKNNVFNILKNSLVFYQTYGVKTKSITSKNVLDRWIKSRLLATNFAVTDHLKNFDVYRAASSIESLIDDLSRWYIRRSRSRFQNPSNSTDLKAASATLREVLLSLSQLIAPFAPFTADIIYQELDGKKESVHLESWPKLTGKIDQRLLKQMSVARELSSLGLAERAALKIKVRQPLAEMKIKQKQNLSPDITAIIEDEVNVKKISFKLELSKVIEFDTNLTPALKTEGQLRELIRLIQGLRADANLKPGEPAVLHLDSASTEAATLILAHANLLKSTTSLKDIKPSSATYPKATKTVALEELGSLTLSLK